MTLKARKGNAGPKDVPTVGTHMARLVGITDLGHQPGFEYQGREIPSAFKYEFTYELVNSKMEDDRPHWVSEEIKNNDFEGKGITSTLMARVRTIDPENNSRDGAELEALLGKPAMVTLSEGTNGYPKIKGQAAVSGIPMGMDVPELENPTFVFDMLDPDMDLFYGFAEFRQDKIKSALDFDETKLARILAEEDRY